MSRSSSFSFRLRAGWPLLALLAATACVLVTLISAERSLRSNRAVADAALTRYAAFATWSYQEHLTEALRVASQEILGGVNMVHQSRPFPGAADLGHGFRWNPVCQCHQPRYGPLPFALAAFTLGSDTLALAFNRAPTGSPGWLADRPMAALGESRPEPQVDSRQRAWINQQLTRLARAPLSRWGYQALIAEHAGTPVAFTLTNMPTAWGDTIVYAVIYSPRAIDSLLASTFTNPDLLPTALTATGTNRQILAAEVRDAAGRVLFTAGAPQRWSRDASTTLPSTYGALTIRMEIQPALADRMIIGGLPRSRLPMLLALLGIAGVLATLAVVQLQRESRFARDRTAFLASTSHELRTPLAQLRLVIDTLRLGREPEPERRDAALVLMDREVSRMQHLVDTVLRFTRGENADPMLPVAVDVATETRAVIAEFAPLARTRSATIMLHRADPSPALLQAGALRQILLNLFDNAVKYGRDGQQIGVDVSTAAGTIRVAVSDTGPGVPADEAERIWRAFQRGSAARTGATAGSGIGLTVVREIAEAHGGRATVEAKRGPGATFVITLPAAS